MLRSAAGAVWAVVLVFALVVGNGSVVVEGLPRPVAVSVPAGLAPMDPGGGLGGSGGGPAPSPPSPKKPTSGGDRANDWGWRPGGGTVCRVVDQRPASEASSSVPGRLGIAGRWWLVMPRLLAISGISAAAMLLVQFGLDQERTYTLLTTVWIAVVMPAVLVAALRWRPHGWAHVGWIVGFGVFIALVKAGHGSVFASVCAVSAGGFVAWQFRLAGWRWLAGSGAEVALSPARMRWRGSYGGHLSATRDGLHCVITGGDQRSVGPSHGQASSLAWTDVVAVEAGFQRGTGADDEASPVPAVRVVADSGTQVVLCVPDPVAVAGACRLRRAAVLVGALRSRRAPRLPGWLTEMVAAVGPIVVVGGWEQSLSDRDRAWVLVAAVTLLVPMSAFSGWQLRRVRHRFAEAEAALEIARTTEVIEPTPNGWEPATVVPTASRTPDARDRLALALLVPLALAVVVPLLVVSSDADSATQRLCWGLALLLMAGVLYGVGPRFPLRTLNGRVAVGLLGLVCCAGISLTVIAVRDIVRSDAILGAPTSVARP